MIGEAERLVAGYRDASTQRRHRDCSSRSGQNRTAGQAQQAPDIDGGADMGGTALDDGVGIAVFGRRHEAEMTRRNHESRIGR